MNIRQGTVDDFSKLDWAWEGDDIIREKYTRAIQEGKQCFLVVEKDDQLIGEVHIWWIVESDLEMGDGKQRAYLSTFRVHDDFQRQGIGSKLISAAFDHIHQNGFQEITIASYEGEDEIEQLYKRWGFTETLRDIVVTDKDGDHACRLHLKSLR